MPKLTEYPQATSFDQNDILIKDGVNGTKKIAVEDVAAYLSNAIGVDDINGKLLFDYAADPNRWRNGAFSSSNWSTTATATRISTLMPLPDSAKTVSVDSGYQYGIIASNDYGTGTWVSTNHVGFWNGSTFGTSATWFQSETVTNLADLRAVGNYYFYVFVAKKPDANMETTECSHVHIISALDSSLTQAGVAADAKGVTDFIKKYDMLTQHGLLNNNNNLDDIVEAGTYCISATASAQPQGMPSDPSYEGHVPGLNASSFFLVVFSSSATTGKFVRQFLIRSGHPSNNATYGASILTRLRDANTWKEWETISLSGRAEATDDVNEFVYPGTYRCTSSALAKNLPSSYGGCLTVYNGFGVGDGPIGYQIYVTAEDGIWFRYKGSSDWYEWSKIAGESKGSYLGIPELKFTGDPAVVASMTKDNGVTLKYDFFGQTGPAVVKWQGSSSTRYAKKNFTIKLDDATEYSTDATYAVGDFAKYSDTIYVCNTAIATPEAWTSGHWDAVPNVSTLRDAPAFNNAVAYSVGAHVQRANRFWECITEIPDPGHAWIASEWKEIPCYDFSPARTDLFPYFSKTSSYTVGKIVKYLGKLYRCTTEVTASASSPKDFTPSDWTEIGFTKKGMDAWYFDRVFINNFYDSTSTGYITQLSTDSRWGMQTKFCAKADYIDPSHMRNVVCARIWGEMVASRGDRIGTAAPAALLNAPNYGAIDGFPITISINGVPNGLYCFNIPKDAWEFNMSSGYVVGGENNSSKACRWQSDAVIPSTITEFSSSSTYAKGAYVVYDHVVYECTTAVVTAGNFKSGNWTAHFEVEVNKVGAGTDDAAAASSLYNAIAAVKAATTDWDTTADVTNVLDVDSVYDYFIFTLYINNNDALARNILYSSYDGTKWHMNAYDLDTTFGFNPYGTAMFSVSANRDADERCNIPKAAAMNGLMQHMVDYSPDKLKARWQKLREGYTTGSGANEVFHEGLLSDEHVFEKLSEFAFFISDAAYHGDRSLWEQMPSTGVVSIPQFMEFYRMHGKFLDSQFNALA